MTNKILNFANDYLQGAHPAILKRLAKMLFATPTKFV